MNPAKSSIKRPTEDDVINWLYRMPAEGVEQLLSDLELKTHGGRFERLHRLYEWLRGEYNAADFEDFGSPEESARKSREGRRWNFVENTCLKENASTRFEECYESGMPHPLTCFLGVSEVHSEECIHDEACDEERRQTSHADSSRTEVSVREEDTHDSLDGKIEQGFEPVHEQQNDFVTRGELVQVWTAFRKFAELAEARFSAMSSEIARLTTTVAELTSVRGQHHRQKSPVSNGRFDNDANRRQASGNQSDSAHRLQSSDSFGPQASESQFDFAHRTESSDSNGPQASGSQSDSAPRQESFDSSGPQVSGDQSDPAPRHESIDSSGLHGSSSKATSCNYPSLGSLRIVESQLSEDPPVQVGVAWAVGESDACAGSSTAHHSDGSSKGKSPEIKYGNPKKTVTICEPRKGSGQTAVRAETEKSKRKTLPPSNSSAKPEAACCSPKGKGGKSTSPSPSKGGKTSVKVSPKKQAANVAASSVNQSPGIEFLVKLLKQMKTISTLCRRYRTKSKASEVESNGNASPVLSAKKTAGRKSRARKKNGSGSFHCYGCGEPNVIRRECPKCSGSEHSGR